jgi:hypothetical protein
VTAQSYIVHSLLRARDWQHRPQLDDVCEWWRRGGRGVCALIGMGGAGKTAVAERFLKVLPGGLPEDPGIPKDSSLPTPHSTFVFSFYDAPNADAFFESLQMWLQNTPQFETRLHVGQMMFLLQQRQGLIVLDGLERVQDDGQRGEFGRLQSPRLRDFLNQLVSGNFSDLSVLITSRFPLSDLRDKNPQFFHPIPVNQIDIAAGVQLLKDRGVRGTDPQLAPIVEQCGQHALTVDFAGGYIAEYGQGDPATPLDLGTAEQLQALLEQGKHGEQDELNDDQRDVLRQGYRFARIAEHYRDAMLEKDEAAMALLERICLFRLGVDSETLAAIFTGEQAVEVSGQGLAALNTKQLQSKLDWLTRMRIVEVGQVCNLPSEQSAGYKPAPRYSIHPAVRTGFLSGIGRDAALAGHEAVRCGLEVSLGDAPGKNPPDPATLDLLEEIVHHTLQSGHVREAWDIYNNRMGQYENLGWRLGAYERGERICRAFAGGQSPETLFRSETRQEFRRNANERTNAESLGDFRYNDQHEAASPRLPTDGDAQEPDASALRRMPFLDLPETTQAIFINEWALYLNNLGRLAAAARCYELDAEMAIRQENWNHASIYNRNLCDVWLLSGRLSRLPKEEGPHKSDTVRKDETDESLPPSSFSARPSEESPATSIRLGAPSDSALATADEALRLAELADDDSCRLFAHAYRANSLNMAGDIRTSLTDVAAALQCQKTLSDGPIWGWPGIRCAQVHRRVGRLRSTMQLLQGNVDVSHRKLGDLDMVSPQCQLVLSSLSIERSGSSSSAAASSADLWTQARDWALARDAKEVLCWSYLVEAQHALARSAVRGAVRGSPDPARSAVRGSPDPARSAVRGSPDPARSAVRGSPDPAQTADRRSPDSVNAVAQIGDLRSDTTAGSETRAERATRAERLSKTRAEHRSLTLRVEHSHVMMLDSESQATAHTALESGLKIARDCGFGLYHIDLLLERARLHLLRGDARAALDDIEMALGDEAGEGGIPANEETGQPELLAAHHPACGYAWAIPAAIQLRAEALLLQAAHEVISVGWASPTKDGSLNPINVNAVSSAHLTIGQLINDAKQLLSEALDLWQPLHDPEPERDDQNFKLDGKEYNYKAAETHRVLTDLEAGILTRYASASADLNNYKPIKIDTTTSNQDNPMASFDVFLSHNSVDKPAVKRLGEALKKRGLSVWLDEWELAPGSSWIEELENIISTCGSSAVCVGASGLGPWEEPEMQGLLVRFMKEKKAGNAASVIPVLLPDAPADVVLPVFLQTLTWLDLRDGMKKDSLDRLQWGITGVKPNP